MGTSPPSSSSGESGCQYIAIVIDSSFKREIQNGSIDLDTDTIKVMLFNSTGDRFSPTGPRRRQHDLWTALRYAAGRNVVNSRAVSWPASCVLSSMFMRTKGQES
jgi:hypothetical protein